MAEASFLVTNGKLTADGQKLAAWLKTYYADSPADSAQMRDIERRGYGGLVIEHGFLTPAQFFTDYGWASADLWRMYQRALPADDPGRVKDELDHHDGAAQASAERHAQDAQDRANAADARSAALARAAGQPAKESAPPPRTSNRQISLVESSASTQQDYTLPPLDIGETRPLLEGERVTTTGFRVLDQASQLLRQAELAPENVTLSPVLSRFYMWVTSGKISGEQYLRSFREDAKTLPGEVAALEAQLSLGTLKESVTIAAAQLAAAEKPDISAPAKPDWNAILRSPETYAAWKRTQERN